MTYRSKRNLSTPGLAAAIAWLLAAACGGDGPAHTGPGTAQLSLHFEVAGRGTGSLRDAHPAFDTADGPITQAVITISGIYLLRDGDEAEGEGSDCGSMGEPCGGSEGHEGGEADEGDGDGGRVWLSRDVVTTDLMALSGDAAALVQDARIPAGEYSQIAFVITGGYIAVEGSDGGTRVYATSPDYEGLPAGTVVDGQLRMPSYAQSGLKVTLPEGTVVEDQQQLVLVTFDVSQSFGHQAGNSGAWVMHPVVHATAVAYTATVRVEVTAADGLVLPSVDGEPLGLGDFHARLTDGAGAAEVQPLADPDGDGVYTAAFVFVDPTQGPYQVDFSSAAGFVLRTDPETPGPVGVSSGEVETYTWVAVGAQPIASP